MKRTGQLVAILLVGFLLSVMGEELRTRAAFAQGLGGPGLAGGATSGGPVIGTTGTFTSDVLFLTSVRTTAGQKLTFDGATEAKYLSSNGTALALTGLNYSAPTFTATGATGNGFGLNSTSANTHGMTFSGVNTLIRSNGAGSTVNLGNGSIWFGIFGSSGMTLNIQTLATCAAGIEGTQSVDVLSGASTGKRTKLCLCTSDGSAAYKWQNVVTGTLGTTTTCGTE